MPSPAPTQADTPPDMGGDGKVLACVSVPNPQSGPRLHLLIQLSSGAASVRLRVFSRALTLITDEEIPGAWHAGWNDLSLSLPGTCNGVYFIQARGAHEPKFSGKPSTLVLIR